MSEGVARFTIGDGSLWVPARAVPLTDRLVTIGATHALSDGRVFPWELNVLFDALEQAAAARRVADSGNGVGVPVSLDSGGQLLTITQAAELSGWPARTLRYAVETGRIPAVRSGRQWLITGAALDNFRFKEAS